MMQSRTHNCGELRIDNVGESVTLVGWLENMREVGSGLGFVVLRDFYGTTQIVLETEEMVKTAKAINKESTISVKGLVCPGTGGRQKRNGQRSVPFGVGVRSIVDVLDVRSRMGGIVDKPTGDGDLRRAVFREGIGPGHDEGISEAHPL